MFLGKIRPWIPKCICFLRCMRDSNILRKLIFFNTQCLIWSQRSALVNYLTEWVLKRHRSRSLFSQPIPWAELAAGYLLWQCWLVFNELLSRLATKMYDLVTVQRLSLLYAAWVWGDTVLGHFVTANTLAPNSQQGIKCASADWPCNRDAWNDFVVLGEIC